MGRRRIGTENLGCHQPADSSEEQLQCEEVATADVFEVKGTVADAVGNLSVGPGLTLPEP